MAIYNTDFSKTYWNDVSVKGYTANGGWIDEVFKLKANMDKASKEVKKTQELLSELNKQSETQWEMSGTANAPIYWKDNEYANSSSPLMNWSAPTTFTVNSNFVEVDHKAIELLFGIKTKEYVPGENCIF